MPDNAEQKLLTIKQFSKLYPAFNEGGLRHLVFNEHRNGFSKCIRRVGRKVLIHVPSFFEWVDEKNGIDTAGQKDTRSGG